MGYPPRVWVRVYPGSENGYPLSYPYPWRRYGFLWVRVWLRLNIPMGYPCRTLCTHRPHSCLLTGAIATAAISVAVVAAAACALAGPHLFEFVLIFSSVCGTTSACKPKLALNIVFRYSPFVGVKRV